MQLRLKSGLGNDRAWIYLISALTAFAPLSTDMYLAAFPSIASDLQTDLAGVQSSLSIFVLGLALGQILYGPLSDRYGRKPPLIVGAAIFVITSLGLMLATSIQSFIFLRLIQAVGGCAGMVLCRAMIADRYSGREATDKLATVMLVGAFAPIVGPVAGSALVSTCGWRSIFLFLTLFGCCCLFAVYWLLPETQPANQRKRSNVKQEIAAMGNLLKKKFVILPLLSGAMAFSALFSFIAGSPAVFMSVFGMSRGTYGWVFAGITLGMVICSQCLRVLLKNAQQETVFLTCMACNLCLTLILLTWGDELGAWPFVLIATAAISALPLASASTTAMTMESGGASKGSLSALLGLTQFGCASIASWLVGILYEETSLSMTLVMLVTACLSLMAFLPLLPNTRRIFWRES
ncbi:multidrug effflux MFS transporter [Pseudomonas putida]|uniref:Bcr/CflA family efflux transporter n=1 Tax=Pseudomonas putida TaxID=303 RepID=A0A4D6XCS1_PSEPU|nr:multidrug effflux MFS transporter [Pseudomonas putida]QCI13519.1 multidrug effflux MFS transporter [Pseudomonas putida]